MAIDSIQLQNFQSHKDTLIELHPGINAIIGESDKGKSSILRGLYLCRYNQPSGEAYVSKWARNEKGIQKKQLSVRVIKDRQQLIRGKGPDMKGYVVNNKEFITLKKNEVPEEVANFFNTTEVNIQEQMDTPFLLGLSSSEKAKFLNDIVDMTDIDLYLSSIDSKMRMNRKDISNHTKEIESLNKQILKYDTLDTLAPMISKYGKIETRIKLKNEAIQQLTEEVNTYKEIERMAPLWDSVDVLQVLLTKYTTINKKLGKLLIDHKKIKNNIKEYREVLTVSDTNDLEKALKRVEKVVKDQYKVTNNLSILKMLVKDYKEYQESIDSTVDFDSLTKKLDNLQKMKRNISGKQAIIDYLEHSFITVRTLQDDITKYTNKIEKLTAEIPEQCPTCGTILKEGA